MEQEQNYRESASETLRRSTQNEKSYFDSAMLSLYVVVLKIFTLPSKAVGNAIKGLTEAENQESDLPMLVYQKQLFEALIILAWPIWAVIILIATYQTDGYFLEEIFHEGWSFIAFCLAVYLTPVVLAIAKEFTTIMLMIVLKLEEISRNTK